MSLPAYAVNLQCLVGLKNAVLARLPGTGIHELRRVQKLMDENPLPDDSRRRSREFLSAFTRSGVTTSTEVQTAVKILHSLRGLPEFRAFFDGFSANQRRAIFKEWLSWMTFSWTEAQLQVFEGQYEETEYLAAKYASEFERARKEFHANRPRMIIDLTKTQSEEISMAFFKGEALDSAQLKKLGKDYQIYFNPITKVGAAISTRGALVRDIAHDITEVSGRETLGGTRHKRGALRFGSRRNSVHLGSAMRAMGGPGFNGIGVEELNFDIIFRQ